MTILQCYEYLLDVVYSFTIIFGLQIQFKNLTM